MKLFTNFTKNSILTNKFKFSFKISKKLFSEEIEFNDKPKIKEISGVYSPVYKSKKSSPKNEMFYGVPITKEIPKSKDDLIKKFEYINNLDDMTDLFYTSENHFTGVELGLFLERLHLIYNRELKYNLNKNKDQHYIIKKESEIKQEYEERLMLFLEEIEKFVHQKNFDFHGLICTYFEILYRFKKEIPKEFSDFIFEEAKNRENFMYNENQKKFEKIDLIKLSYILVRYKQLLNTKENAQEGLLNTYEEIFKIGLANFTKEEILTLVVNLSYQNAFPNLEVFTRFEPHILKYLNEYAVVSLIKILSAYVRNLRGSNFFIQSVGFSIASNLQFCGIKDLMQILELSPKKYFNRPELSIKFSDLFLNIFSLITPHINELRAKDISVILRGMINCSFNDKKLLHLLSTVYLKFTDTESFYYLVYTTYYFAVLDLDNTIFIKKSLEIISLNLICLKHHIDGNENLDNLIGIYDSKFIKLLQNKFVKNVEQIQEKLKFFERILYDENEIFTMLDMLCKNIWTINFFMSKIKDLNLSKDDDLEKLLLNSVNIFNNFVSNLKLCEENGVAVKIIKSNIEKLFQAYLNLMILSQKFNIKININLHFLKLDTILLLNNNDEIYDVENFIKFKESVVKILGNNSDIFKIKKLKYEEDFSDVNDYEYYKFLRPSFILLKEVEGEKDLNENLVFINDPYNYFEVSMNFTGFNKFRNNLCRTLKLNFVEVDYQEFLVFYKDIEINEDNLDNLIAEFLQIKLG